MKKTLPILFLLLVTILAKAQIIRVATTPSAIASQIPGYSQVTTITTKTYSYTPSTQTTPPTPVDEDSTTEDSKLYRYADNIAVSITNSDGNITSTSVGKVWTLRIRIPNALNVGFVFNQFNLSPTAEMYIFNEARTVLDSAIKKSHFTNSSQVGIFPIKGNSAIIYIVEPNNFGTLQSSISIQKIEAGFQEIEDVGDAGGVATRGASINCNPMIMCQPNRMNSARAVARFASNGHVCTGTLLNNENNNGRAFFLTAFHCIDVGGGIFGWSNGQIDADEEAALANARFQFQFWKTTCNGSVNNTGIQFTGAVIRAAWKNSDVVLLELINPPGVGDGVNYAGWNRQTSAPSDNYSYIIHHPKGEDMRVTSTKKVKDWFWNNMFWTAHYSSGTVTGGSSGSALFNQYGQVVGQLRGGWSSCNFTDFGDRYGKFNHSWNGAGLQPWLSPTQGLNSINTLILSPLTISGSDFIGCPAPDIPFSVPNLLGGTYTWTHSANIMLVSGQNTSTAIFRNISNLQTDAGWVRVTINDSKGRNRTQTVTRNVQLISQTPKPGPISWTWNAPPNRVMLDVDDVPGATSYKWYLDGVLKATTTASYYHLPMNGNVSCGNFYYFGVRAVGACGTSPESYVGATMPPCGFAYTVSPNPSFDNVSIESNDNTDSKANGKKSSEIQEVEIIDKMGALKQKQKFTKGMTRVNIFVSTLPTDVYTLRIFDGQIWHSTKIVVQH